jgi:hypothetical protein
MGSKEREDIITNKNISNDKISGILDSAHSTRVFDDDLGIFLSCVQVNCFVCKTEQSMIMLLSDKRKLDTDNFYCRACDIGTATNDSMKRYIEDFRKERDSFLKFPDETVGAHIEEMRKYQPNIVQMVNELVEAVEAGDSIFISLANDMRHTKTYRAYPKSLGDENRLFMTISSYFERFEHRFEGKNGNEQFDVFVKLVKQDQRKGEEEKTIMMMLDQLLQDFSSYSDQ